MATYYHVTTDDYSLGEALWCRDELLERGVEVAWKWDADEGLDGDVVCLFEARDEAEEFRRDWLPTGRILAVELPEDWEDWGIRMTRVDEGYPAVYRTIPAEFIRAADEVEGVR